jgi:hypothetical protein
MEKIVSKKLQKELPSRVLPRCFRDSEKKFSKDNSCDLIFRACGTKAKVKITIETNFLFHFGFSPSVL